jgi:hypothetical protein
LKSVVTLSTLGLFLFVGTSFGASKTVASGGDLQSALNQAVGGDTITLTAGAVFTGNFTMPANSSGNDIVIISSGWDPDEDWTRVSPSSVSSMATIRSSNASPAITFSSGSNHIRIVGLEVKFQNTIYGQDLIVIGSGSETNENSQPNHIVVDRCYIHGGNSGGKRGIALNSAYTIIENNYISNFFNVNSTAPQDTQAICGWNGPGPFAIVNNYLEAASEILAFGGTTPAINDNPSNIMVTGNDLTRPSSWQSTYGNTINVKNAVEVKFGNRINLNANHYWNNWVSGTLQQFGDALLFKTECDWAGVTTNDIHVTNSWIETSWSGVRVAGKDGTCGDGGGFYVYNLLEDLEQNSTASQYGRGYTILGIKSSEIHHSTIYDNASYPVVFDSAQSQVSFFDNVFQERGGVVGNGTSAGNNTFATWDPGYAFKDNVMIGADNSANYSALDANWWGTSVPFTWPGTDGPHLSSSYTHYTDTTDGVPEGGDMGRMTSVTTAVPVMFVSLNSGQCLMPDGHGSTSGTQTVQNWCYDGQSQLWDITAVSGGYKVINHYSGLALTAGSGYGAITTNTYTGASNQIFNFNVGVNGWAFNLRPHSDTTKSVDVDGASKWEETTIHLWDNLTDSNQEWHLVPTTDQFYSYSGSVVP